MLCSPHPPRCCWTGTALMMWTATPRQCAPGAAPPGVLTLFQLNRGAFGEVQALLDFPFATYGTPPGVLALPDQALCSAVFFYVQLTLGFLLPAAVLLATEARERRQFLRELRGGERPRRRRESSSSSSSSSSRTAAAEGEASGPALSCWLCFLCVAEVCWCVIRTAVTKLGT